MATINLQVGASTDDATESAVGTMALSSQTDTLTSTSAWWGWRFLNVTIPAGSTINTATMQVYTPSADHDDIHIAVYAEDVDDATTFTSDANNISSRTRTTANTAWDANAVGVDWQVSPSLVAVIQEIVDRGSWASGNDIALIGDCTAGIDLTLRHWDYTGNAHGAKLDIDYTAPTGGQPMSLRATTVPHMRQWQPGAFR